MAEPDQDQITIPGYRRGFNCRLSAPGYGRTAVRAMEMLYGVNIVPGAGSSDEGRSRRVFYPLVTTSSSFGMAIVHISRSDRNGFNKWMRGWMQAVAGNQSVGGGMKIEIPGRRFVRTGVCTGTLHYGEAVGELDSGASGQFSNDDPETGRGLFITMLDFIGATQPISGVGTSNVKGDSFFVASTLKRAAHFYPAANQVSGASSLEGTIFDETPDEVYTEQAAREDYTAGRASGLIPGNVSYDNYRLLVLGN